MLRYFLFFSIFWVSTTTFGQLKPAQSAFRLQDTAKSAVSPKVYDLLTFPNLGKVAYYRDAKSFANLQKLAKRSDREALYPRLFSYVQQFGVQNFIEEAGLLWKLAKLEERQGDTVAAVAIYKLILKHHPQGVEAQEARGLLQDFGEEQQEDYVPLEYYYELVEFRKEIDTLRPPRGVYLNMGDGLNSTANDYGPALSASSDVLLFTSKRHKRSQGLKEVDNEDLMISYRQDDDWSLAEPLEGINSMYNEGSACLSPDGTTLFFARCNAPDGSGSCDLYVSTRQGGQSWSAPRNLGTTVNSASWDSHPALSRTGDTLFFASDRLGGFGLSDIYYTHRDAKGQWLQPKNMGPVVNTRGSEVSPFFHPEHNVLYFSSNGHLLNFGEYDIYKSYRYRDIWNEPKNIGPLVNGVGSEFYFTIDAQSQNLYYARSVEDQMGNLDLYSFPLPMEAKPTATINLDGSLVNSETGKPFRSGIVSIIDLDNGVEVAPKNLREDGTFAFKLINNNRYLIIIQGEEFFRLEEVFFLTGDRTFNFETMPISSRIQFSNMEFDNGKSEIKPEMYADLDKIINFLMDNPNIQLHIEGHTDSDGNPELNRKLSQSRADAIRTYLIDFGSVAPDRIRATGYGSSKPIVDEKTAADKKLNRRVEFKIDKK
jgi:outer membrane protein OmpA-like peptidoglycan-associated protein